MKPETEEQSFWLTKTLAEMSGDEWEALCDSCGQCCLKKFIDEETQEIFYTAVACELLDREACRCRDYKDRHTTVPECIELTPAILETEKWLPETCAYRLIAEGKPLEWWHPLVSGDVETVHAAGISVRGRTIPADQVHPDDLEMYVVGSW